MKVPLSWLREWVDLPESLDELARQLTWAGLEVEEIRLIGLPPPAGELHQTKYTGLTWEKDKIVVGAIYEVHPHPDADRLTLLQLDDGIQIHTVLTGAPSLLPLKTKGKLEKPLKVAYAREGALLYDGHSSGLTLTRLKRTKIRGVVSYSMVCSEKELGISEEAEDIIYLSDDAPVGMPLADYMGDAVLEIAITPNMARAANIIGIAREIAAINGTALRYPSTDVVMQGKPIQGRVAIQIQNPALNPRFVLGLIENITIKPSPSWVQQRLKLAGMRPINNIVDVTNYVMLELGEPLHAFDYDVLLKRSGGKPPTIITRTAYPGEKLTTLDGITRTLDEFTVLVCDTQGPLSIAGVMGGAESEVTDTTRNILLEGASWDYINIRKTISAQKLESEAAYRFSRGVHPSLAKSGVLRALELMRQWSGGIVAQGCVDEYPLPAKDPLVEITTGDVKRWLGIELQAPEIANILERLEFKVQVKGDVVHAATPDHRLDIHEGVIGKADLMEEIARIYGYDRIPETRIADELPPQYSNPAFEFEEKLKDILVRLGLQEVISHRMTSAATEARLFPRGAAPEINYVRLLNPISSDKDVMRSNLLSSVMECVEHNARVSERIALFELGPVFIPLEQYEPASGSYCKEPKQCAIVLSGSRTFPHWDTSKPPIMDFYDLKGIVTDLLEALHVSEARFVPFEHPTFHTGKCAKITLPASAAAKTESDDSAEIVLGMLGELHPLVRENYKELPSTPIYAALLDIEVLRSVIPTRLTVQPVPVFPPVLEDLAFVVSEEIPAQQVINLIQQTAGKLLSHISLFDVYRGEKIGSGKKSLAYSLTYQAPDRTLTDDEVAKIRNRIIQRLEKELGAKLRDA